MTLPEREVRSLLWELPLIKGVKCGSPRTHPRTWVYQHRLQREKVTCSACPALLGEALKAVVLPWGTTRGMAVRRYGKQTYKKRVRESEKLKSPGQLCYAARKVSGKEKKLVALFYVIPPSFRKPVNFSQEIATHSYNILKAQKMIGSCICTIVLYWNVVAFQQMI